MNPEETTDWVPFLRRTRLFRDLTAQDVAKVAAQLKPLSLPKGATLYSRGDVGDAFYLITSGQVRLLSERGGREVVTAFLGRGDALGEISLLTGEPRSVTVKLDTTSEFLMLAKDDFEKVVRETPAMLIHLSRLIAQRMVKTSQIPEPGQMRQRELVALISALEASTHCLFHVHLALRLVEETRQRVLLVDMSLQCGAFARALAMRPVLTSESMLREQDLRDPMVLRNLVNEHPSGLHVLSLPPSVLGGRLYRGIFLFLNLLRDHYDVVLVSLGETLGDVERSILEEADRWLLLGCQAKSATFERLESELRPAAEAAMTRGLKVWLGGLGSVRLAEHERDPLFLIPWTQELTAEYERGVSPHQVLDRFPKSARSIRRLARRLGRRSIGLAMGAGAALGYSLIGILKGLERAHIDVDIVSGTSIGALVAGLYALGMDIEEMERIATRIDRAWVYENLFWDLTLPRSGIFAGATLLRFLRSHFGEKQFHELELPFACVATDIETGEAVILREGRVAEAVRASCGLPLLFMPFHHQGRFLVDGGLVDPVPSRVIAQMGADILLSVNLTLPAAQRKTTLRRRQELRMLSARPLRELALPEVLRAPHMGEILFQMIYTMEYEIAKSRLDLVHVIIQPDMGSFSWTEFYRAREIIEQGERAAEEAIPKIKALLPYFADYCRIPLRPAPWQDY